MVDTPWLNDVEDTAWRGVRRLNVLTLATISRDLQRHFQLSDADYEVLTGLSETPDDQCRFGDLAATTHWSTSRLSHHLERMQQRGLVERYPTTEDARGSVVALTALGRTTIERAAPHHLRSVRRHLFDQLSAEQTTQLADIVTSILNTNEADRD